MVLVTGGLLSFEATNVPSPLDSSIEIASGSRCLKHLSPHCTIGSQPLCTRSGSSVCFLSWLRSSASDIDH